MVIKSAPKGTVTNISHTKSRHGWVDDFTAFLLGGIWTRCKEGMLNIMKCPILLGLFFPTAAGFSQSWGVDDIPQQVAGFPQKVAGGKMLPNDFGDLGEIYGNVTTHPEYHMFVDYFVSLMVDHATKNQIPVHEDLGFQHELSKKIDFEEKQAATFPRLKTHNNYGPPTYPNQNYPRRNYRPSLKNPCFWWGGGGPVRRANFASFFEGFPISTFPMGFLWHERRWLARKHPWWCWSHVAQWGHPWRGFSRSIQ